MARGSAGRFASPLRYPGGKGKLANFFKLLILENDMVGADYAELYAGGASVAFELLFEEYVGRIHINDINRSVHAFWSVALSDPDGLCERIRDTPITTQSWKTQRAVQGDPDAGTLDLAFSTFFLNRTNRSGIIDAGMIGGAAQQGEWLLDARFTKDELIKRIQKIGRFSSRVTLTRLDAAQCLISLGATIDENTLVYLDPPYYVMGGRLYESAYGHEDHETISRLIRALPSPWVVSYDAVPEILKMYDGVKSIRYNLQYSAQARYSGSEVMFFSPGLNPAVHDSPAGIRRDVVDAARLALIR